MIRFEAGMHAQVIVVDVEDRDASVWQNLSAYDGGVSGWRLLWDRWCPIPSLRCAQMDVAAPRCTPCQRHAPHCRGAGLCLSLYA